MSDLSFNLPIFPLPVFLLPQGVTRLRIFEPRYLKMVAIASQGQGFAILLTIPANSQSDKTLKNELQHKLMHAPKSGNWASWVEIINFEQEESGLLIIDVKCKALVEIKTITQDKDKLCHGDVIAKSHWPPVKNNEVSAHLTELLFPIFEQTPELKALYQQQFVYQAEWVVARWLELLPIDLAVKAKFAQAHTYKQAVEFIHAILEK